MWRVKRACFLECWAGCLINFKKGVWNWFSVFESRLLYCWICTKDNRTEKVVHFLTTISIKYGLSNARPLQVCTNYRKHKSEVEFISKISKMYHPSNVWLSEQWNQLNNPKLDGSIKGSWIKLHGILPKLVNFTESERWRERRKKTRALCYSWKLHTKVSSFSKKIFV